MTETIIASTRVKHALHEGKLVLGTMVAEIRQASIMQLLANAGFDFCIIDNEHGPFSIETIADLSRAARLYGITPIVRVPDLAYPYLAQSLDVGAQGVMLPRITNAEQVRQAVQIIKYPPVGARGCAQNRAHTNFLAGNVADVMARANAETLLVVQIETKEALEQVEEIVAVPGVDAAFIGPNDLSIALGVHGQTTSPTMVAAMERVVAACQKHNVAAAIQLADVQLATQWIQKGIHMVSYAAETMLLMNAGLAATSALRKAVE